MRVDQLRALGKSSDIDALYESLTLSMPERAEYYILLAEVRISMDNNEAALPVLAQIENHHQLRGRARELIDAISGVGNPLTTIPLIRTGEQFLVNAVVDGREEVVMLVDTGASMTVIDPAVLDRLGYSLNGHSARFATANGNVTAPVEMLSSLSLSGTEVRSLRIGALPIARSGQRVDGLLGMDFLSQFEFVVDQDAEVLARRNNQSSK